LTLHVARLVMIASRPAYFHIRIGAALYSVTSRVRETPEASWKLAGGEAQRNHRNPLRDRGSPSREAMIKVQNTLQLPRATAGQPP
jgi:hypothetical protein